MKKAIKKTKVKTKLNIEGRVGTMGPIDFSSKEFQELKAKVRSEYESLSNKEKVKIEFDSLKQKINTYLENEDNQIKNFDYFVNRYLDVLEIKQKDFASFLNYNHTNFNKILKGKRSLNYDLAIKIAESFELDPELLLMIQMKNHLKRYKSKKKFSPDKLISYSITQRKKEIKPEIV